MNKTRKNEYNPDYVSPPGETLQELLDTQGLSQADLSIRTGRPKKTINEIILGKAAITPDTAIQLERVLNVPAEFWLTREAHYRAWLAHKDDDLRIDKEKDLVKQLPLKDMESLGWIEKFDDTREKFKAILSFFGVVSLDRLPFVEEAAFRKSEKFAVNKWALAAWLRKGELEAQKIRCRPYNSDKFLEALSAIRTLTAEDPKVFVPKLISHCANAGVCLVFIPELPKTSVSGATRWLSPDKAMIQLSLRCKCNDMFWFSFFHEAGHVYNEHAKREVLLETDFKGFLDQREIIANKFATDLLISKIDFTEFVGKSTFSAESIKQFSRNIGVASGIVVGRLQHEKIIGWERFRTLKKEFSWDQWPKSCSNQD